MTRVHALLDEAERAGEKAPGRVLLRRLTGATENQIRTAKAERKIRASFRDTATGNDLDLSPDDDPTGEPGTSADQPTDADPVERAPADVNAGEPGTRQSPTAIPPALAPAKTTPGGGKVVAWIGFTFGSVVSVAANVLAAWIAPEHAPTGWHPSIAAQVGAAVWPLGLLLAVEVVSRVPRPSTWTGMGALFGGIGVVASGSAVISYGHIRAVLESWAYSPLGAGVGPLVVDGLMMVCGVAMLAKPGVTPVAPVADVIADVAGPVIEPALPISYAALDLANRAPIAPAGDAWRLVGDRLADTSDHR